MEFQGGCVRSHISVTDYMPAWKVPRQALSHNFFPTMDLHGKDHRSCRSRPTFLLRPLIPVKKQFFHLLHGRSENHINAGLTVPLFLLRSSAQAAPLPAFCYLSPYLSCHFSFIFRLYNALAIIPNADKINTICMLSTGMFKILISFANATNVDPSMDEKNPTNPTIVEQKLT